MKTAISIPDPVYRSADALARRLKLSRSQLYATAVADFVARHKHQQVTDRLNAVYDEFDAAADKMPLALSARSVPRDTW